MQPRIKSYDLIVGCEIVYCNGLFEKFKKEPKGEENVKQEGNEIGRAQ